jgi:hypothetical protein
VTKTHRLILVAFLKRAGCDLKHIDDGGIISERGFQHIRKRK